MTIKLLWKYIKYDVDQLTHRYAAPRIDSPELRDMADLSGSSQSDENLIRRYVLTGAGKLRLVLADYIEKVTTESNDKLQAQTEWEFKFKDEIADSRGLAELMHWFIVRFAVWQWCKMYAPTQASLEESEVNSLMDDLDDLAGNWPMPIKERRTDGVTPQDTEVIIVYGE